MKRLLSLVFAIVLMLSATGCGKKNCTAIATDTTQITLSHPGDTWGLNVTKHPADATDKVYFDSSNVAVATVNEYGLITAVGTGSTTIMVICGDATAFCHVEVNPDGVHTDVPASPEVTPEPSYEPAPESKSEADTVD